MYALLNAEAWITKCGTSLMYKPMLGKEVVYIVPVSSVLGRLPIVRAGDTGTIPFRYSLGLQSSLRRFVNNLAHADLSPGAGDSCPMFFVNFWAL